MTESWVKVTAKEYASIAQKYLGCSKSVDFARS
jgi:hypothetical protein